MAQNNMGLHKINLILSPMAIINKPLKHIHGILHGNTYKCIYNFCMKYCIYISTQNMATVQNFEVI